MINTFSCNWTSNYLLYISAESIKYLKFLVNIKNWKEPFTYHLSIQEKVLKFSINHAANKQSSDFWTEFLSMRIVMIM